MSHRLGYLVPEFPSQGHSFIRREILELRRRGAALDLVSTQLPKANVMCHDWSAEAITETVYLIPLGIRSAWRAARVLVGAGPATVGRCLRLIAGARSLSIMERLRVLPMIVVAAALVDLARTRNWQHLHVHSCGWCALLARFAHALSGVPYSMTLHGPGVGDTYGGLQREKWEAASFGIVVTSVLLDKLRQEVPSFPLEQLKVAPMGVDATVFRRDCPLELPPSNGVWRIVSCGRLKPMKGHEYLLSAAAQLVRAGVRVELTILGEGSERPTLEALIADLQLNGVATLPGAVSEERVRAALAQAHIFVLASLDEAIGVAVMEAMAMELPVIGTAVGGVRELVRDGIDGYLVPPGDSAAIAQALFRVMVEPARAVQMGRSGSIRVAAQFGCERSALALLEMLRKTAKPPLTTPITLPSRP